MNRVKNFWLPICLGLYFTILSPASRAVTGPDVPRLHGIKGDFAGQLTLAGRLDVPRMIAKLKEANINTYAYLINRLSQPCWDDLPGFLDAAQKEGIKVWVYLVPPSEAYKNKDGSLNYPPFNDYVAWAQAIAALSNKYPNLQAIAMDDFAGNASLTGTGAGIFTPQYVTQMMDAAHARNPTIGFWPVLYYDNFKNGRFPYKEFLNVFDGVIFPYLGNLYPNYDNTTTSTLAPQVVEIQGILSDKQNLPSDEKKRSSYHIGFPSQTPSRNGWYSEISQSAAVYGGSSSALSPAYSIQFWVRDSYVSRGATSGYHYIQFLVNDSLVWEEDVAGNQDGWHLVSLDLGSHLTGLSTAKISFRVVDKKGVSNFPINVYFDEVQTKGFTLQNADFEDVSSTAWQMKTNGSSWINNYATTTRNIPLVVMGYAARYAAPMPAPLPQYIADLTNITTSLEKQGFADGFMTYVLNKSGIDVPTVSYAATYDTIKALYTKWRPGQTQQLSVSYPFNTTSAPGDYGQVSQMISPLPGAANYRVGFWTKDDYIGNTAGYVYKQVVIDDDEVVWQEDVARDEFDLDQGLVSVAPHGWHYVYLDLTKQLKGKGTAKLALRVTTLRGIYNFGVTVRFDQVTSEGFSLVNPSFDQTTGWSFNGTNPSWVTNYGN